MPFGAIAKKMAIIIRRMSDLIRKTTRNGMVGLRIIMTIGSVINIATPKDVRRDVETTIGIALIKSPIIPVAKRSGTNAQTVVSVVVETAVRKSLHTSRPASIGVNFPVR